MTRSVVPRVAASSEAAQANRWQVRNRRCSHHIQKSDTYRELRVVTSLKMPQVRSSSLHAPCTRCRIHRHFLLAYVLACAWYGRWQVALQYLSLHLTHRGASWASGRGAGGASCEDHFAFFGELLGLRAAGSRLEKNPFFQLNKIIATRYRRPARRRQTRPQPLLVLVRQVHLDRHPRPTTIVPQLQPMTVRDRPTGLAARPEGHDRRVRVVLQLD